MRDLISKQAAIKAIDDLPNCYNGYSDAYDKAYIIGVLEELPSVTADMATLLAYESGKRSAEPKSGKWIKDKDVYSLYKCTSCNNLCTVAGWANCIPEEQMYKAFKFCPNCGAQMERSEE